MRYERCMSVCLFMQFVFVTEEGDGCADTKQCTHGNLLALDHDHSHYLSLSWERLEEGEDWGGVYS